MSDPSAASAEPPQASSRYRRTTARAKTPRKSRDVLISLQSLRLLGRGGVARPHTSTRRGIACLGARQGGVNAPVSLPAWRPVRLRRCRCRWLAVPRGSADGKEHPPGERHKPQFSGRGGGIALRKQPVCLQSSTVGRRARSVSRVTSGGQKTGCANRVFSVQRPFPVCKSLPRTTWVQGLFPRRNQDRG